ncbi:MAG: D-2-hydroxyacid dehydrogenase [Beijerinckiaceae bacterium]
MAAFPEPARLRIGFAHPAYQLEAEFLNRRKDIKTALATSIPALDAMIPDVDVLLVSGLWRNTLLAHAKSLKFVQSISAGTDQYDRNMFRERGVRLASAQGANERAVAEHALALMLALSRHLHLGRDAQAKRLWRPMIGDPRQREQEQRGRSVVVIGFGRIGQRFGRMARALDCNVIGLRREAIPAPDAADSVMSIDDLDLVLPQADVVVLTCPLTPQTERLINAQTLALMKPSAHLINVARGKVVDEAALVATLQAGALAAAALDMTEEEPLLPSSPLWAMPNVIITPHSAGETGRYEANVIDILEDNLARLWRGETDLKNQIV